MITKQLRCQHPPDEEEVKEEVQCWRDLPVNGYIIAVLTPSEKVQLEHLDGEAEMCLEVSPAQQKKNNKELCESDQTPDIQEREGINRDERV